ncbi:MAG: GNAT family N-acetyltransferase [Coriobacteriales bacterium]|jgi:phosphinothricin acetyltransferase|nr:GNAT family N-acetyltransferase [Coriobacteriales bacterium]
MPKKAKVAIRLAVPEDSQDILDLYTPYVTDTVITFVSTPPTVEEIAAKMLDIQRHYPYLVCTFDDKVVGFAYANWVRPHEAYRWNAELSIYVDRAYHGRGIATALYTALLQILKAQGFCNLYAVITLPNDASVALHRHFGFTDLSVHKASGYKLGAWQDVLWMEYRIDGCADPGTHGLPVAPAMLHTNEIQTALGLATALLSGAQG